MSRSDTRVKLACYAINISQAIVLNASPLLFLTFHTLYDISYSLLGLLVLINFVTQLAVDLLFSFFLRRIDVRRLIRIAPCLVIAGLLLFALAPVLFPHAVYMGLALGTVLFSAAGGFVEVFVSPIIAALPAKDPDREMSKLHSTYAWGVVGMVLTSTVFFALWGGGVWQWLILVFLSVPILSWILFFGADIPAIRTHHQMSGILPFLKNRGFWLCVFGIFCGGAAECTMGQWSSSYLEQALGIPKMWGDLFGVALFALMLGLGRTLYARWGKNVVKILFLGSACAAICYLVAALSPIPLIGLIACAVTGFFTAMLWPGSLIAAADRFPTGGVFLYAMMAAGGDMGASVAPQAVGLITDAVIASPKAEMIAASLSLSPDQLGMKLGMLVGMVFPLIGAVLFYRMMKQKRA